MALILVVEPDTARAGQVTALARTDGHAEVIAVRSASEACATLADVIPDVVLLSTLLPAHDEGRIAAELRALGPDARHVQLLTIPIVTPRPEPSRRGLLSALLRRRHEEPDDPPADEWALFARRVAEYAELAEALRPHRPQRERPRVSLILLPPTETVAGGPPLEDEPAAAAFDQILPLPFAVEPQAAPADDDDSGWIVIDLTALTEEPAAAARPIKPVEDEWGLFDPEQCGFAALLARLDALAASGGPTPVDTAASVRVVDY